ncbi:hypothetical protein BD324DRAFT_261635 [Kockovaella imperatae]|uniref:Uncharacterized protein n=1 Tax=Kockovaella imperatae TaxID=4999 RepID=A0A1Y1UQ70_9TREE|nr:hypothetical protein BD324DRAFT_261635 [Kockovaella imperatae]ORX40149.1 hypothetical protein BD324DRAFT_261635 [Kockovaella imperatae]
MKRIETREIKGSAGPGSIEEAWRDQSLWTHLSVEEAVIHDCTLRRHQSRLLIWSMMLLLSTVISLACVLGVESLPTWIDSRWSTVKECITDLKVVSCDDFDCGLEGYHRIDSFLNLSENTTVWNYVFYKSELDQDPGNCITDLRVVPEGEDCPTAPYWKSCGVSAHHGVTSTGGPTIWAQYEPGAQYAGEVVDLVVLRPGQYPDKTEDFIRQPVNLGLGSRAASASYPQWVEYESISSGWVWLVST